jgi:hypothetical protein
VRQTDRQTDGLLVRTRNGGRRQENKNIGRLIEAICRLVGINILKLESGLRSRSKWRPRLRPRYRSRLRPRPRSRCRPRPRPRPRPKWRSRPRFKLRPRPSQG